MSCLMFINGSHMCTKTPVNESLLCDEHECKKILSDTCNICLDEMKEYVFVQCGHSFHKECINEWLLEKRTCPCCRTVIKLEINQYINNELNRIYTQINDYERISMTREFIDWFFETARTYVHDTTNISLLDMLYVIQQPRQFNYYMTIYLNDRNNISIDLFELELKLNQIANCLRNSDINSQENNEDEDDEEDEDEHLEYINISELEFTEFQ